MSSTPQETYEALCNHVRQTAVLSSVEDLLGWDEQTGMPPEAAEYRAEQSTLLAGMIHQRSTDPKVGEWLSQLVDGPLASAPSSDTGATIRHLNRDYEKQLKIPQSLVEEQTRTSVLAQQAWMKARGDDDFASFQPWLEKTFDLKRQEAECLGYAETPYDALLDQYEPDTLTSTVSHIFAALREDIVRLVSAIADSPCKPKVELLEQSYPKGLQASFGRDIAERIGFDFQRGRLDVSAHPFCSRPGPHDCRMTTRYQEHDFGDAFFSILHEAGHGIYEQGLPPEHYGLPLGDSVSLGIHESQSRLWENLVGRSRAFWDYLYPELQQTFSGCLKDVPLDDFYPAVNTVRPSLIRTEADEVTYNLHIFIRFELEQALLSEELPVADLPAAWREKYRDYLGVEPTSDADGVLQDIHWSAGLVGYFPTYALGNLYAAQLFATADAALGDVSSQIRRGEFTPLRNWLRENIHQHGQRYAAVDLVQRATGTPPSHQPFIENLQAKFAPLYEL